MVTTQELYLFHPIHHNIRETTKVCRNIFTNWTAPRRQMTELVSKGLNLWYLWRIITALREVHIRNHQVLCHKRQSLLWHTIPNLISAYAEYVINQLDKAGSVQHFFSRYAVLIGIVRNVPPFKTLPTVRSTSVKQINANFYPLLCWYQYRLP